MLANAGNVSLGRWVWRPQLMIFNQLFAFATEACGSRRARPITAMSKAPPAMSSATISALRA